jgi:hypothetical protein
MEKYEIINDNPESFLFIEFFEEINDYKAVIFKDYILCIALDDFIDKHSFSLDKKTNEIKKYDFIKNISVFDDIFISSDERYLFIHEYVKILIYDMKELKLLRVEENHFIEGNYINDIYMFSSDNEYIYINNLITEEKKLLFETNSLSSRLNKIKNSNFFGNIYCRENKHVILLYNIYTHEKDIIVWVVNQKEKKMHFSFEFVTEDYIFLIDYTKYTDRNKNIINKTLYVIERKKHLNEKTNRLYKYKIKKNNEIFYIKDEKIKINVKFCKFYPNNFFNIYQIKYQNKKNYFIDYFIRNTQIYSDNYFMISSDKEMNFLNLNTLFSFYEKNIITKNYIKNILIKINFKTSNYLTEVIHNNQKNLYIRSWLKKSYFWHKISLKNRVWNDKTHLLIKNKEFRRVVFFTFMCLNKKYKNNILIYLNIFSFLFDYYFIYYIIYILYIKDYYLYKIINYV